MTYTGGKEPEDFVNTFRSKQLKFEPVVLAHAEKLFAALGDSRVHQYIDSKDFLSLQSVADFINRVSNGPQEKSNDEWLNLVCFLDDEVIGLIQATLHRDWVEIAYLFSPSFQGKGLAAESVEWLIAHVKTRYGIGEFWATTSVDNVRSIALLKRTGFIEVQTWQRDISSYDPGDAVFQLNHYKSND